MEEKHVPFAREDHLKSKSVSRGDNHFAREVYCHSMITVHKKDELMRRG